MTSAISNGRGKLLDLQAAASAAATEAEKTPFSFEYKGEEYEIPPTTAWPVSAVLLLAEGQLGQALPVLLGADAAERLVAAGLTAQELKFLFSVVGEGAGFPSLPDFSQPAQPSSALT